MKNGNRLTGFNIFKTEPDTQKFVFPILLLFSFLLQLHFPLLLQLLTLHCPQGVYCLMVPITTFSMCDSQHLLFSALYFTGVTDSFLISFSILHASIYSFLCFLAFIAFFSLLLYFLLYFLVFCATYTHCLERGLDKATQDGALPRGSCTLASGYWQVYT